MDIYLFENYCEIVFFNVLGLICIGSIVSCVCKCVYLQVKETIRKENK